MEKSWKRDVLKLKTKHCVIYWVKVGKILYNKIPRQAISHEIEGLETTGGKMGSLNNQIKFPELRNKCDIVQILGALMLSIDIRHPDVEEFIDIKRNTDQITHANISVRVNDEFMKAVEEDRDYLLHWPCDMSISKKELDAVPEYGKMIHLETECGPVYLKKIKAKDLFMRLAENNWDYAEPGILYWDRISNWNMMANDPEFEYAGVNPCKPKCAGL